MFFSILKSQFLYAINLQPSFLHSIESIPHAQQQNHRFQQIFQMEQCCMILISTQYKKQQIICKGRTTPDKPIQFYSSFAFMIDPIKEVGRFNYVQYLLLIINKLMSRITNDEQYNNDKELKKSHSVISIKKRQKLIQLVIQQNMTIYRAAKRLKICHPTAKFIVKNYRLAHNLPRPNCPPSSHLPNVQGALTTQSSLIQKEEQLASPTQTHADRISSPMQPLLDQSVLLANMWAFYGNNCLLHPFYYYS